LISYVFYCFLGFVVEKLDFSLIFCRISCFFNTFHIQNRYFIDSSLVFSCIFVEKLIISLIFYYFYVFSMIFCWKTWFFVEFLSNFMFFRQFHKQNPYFIDSSLVFSCFVVEKLVISVIYYCFLLFFHVSSLKNLIFHWFPIEFLAFLANFTYKIHILLTRHWYFHVFCSKTNYFFDFSIVFY